MRVYVTGSNGYLGGHLLKALEKQGNQYFGMDSHGKVFRVSPGTDWQGLNPLDAADAVVHLAWYSSAGDKEPAVQEECLERTKKLVDEVDKRWWQRFVFLSTVTVYGDADREVDELTVPAPNCAYSRAKLAAEDHVRQRLPSRYLVLRSSSLMGLGVTRTKTQLVVNSIAKDAWTKGRIELWNPGAWKPVTHVQDVAEILCRALKEKWGGTYDVAAWNYRAVEIARMASGITGTEIVEVPDGSGHRSCWTQAKKLRGMVPEMQFRDVRQTIYEFEGFKESPSDVNVSWITRHAPARSQ